jgi:hypothetical protein
MKVAIIFATDGSRCEDAVVAPFRAAHFVEGLRIGGIEPVMITIAPDQAAEAATAGELRCRPNGLAALLAAERPQAIQTFGPEHRLAAIWPIAAQAGVPIVHCVSCWRDGPDATPSGISSFAASRVKRASRHVTALIGTSRATVGGLVSAGCFPHATSSVIVPPPVERVAVAAPAPAKRTQAPVFGVYDPCASSDLVAFVSHAVELTGLRNAARVRIAMRVPVPTASASIAITAPTGIDGLLAEIDVLAVPAYDDAVAPALIAALRAGRSVIVPDPSGAAELIEYGRHGLMFCAGSAYHLANAMDLVGQSWSERPVLQADGGPAIARTHPAAVAHTFVTVYERLVPAADAAQAKPGKPSHG